MSDQSAKSLEDYSKALDARFEMEKQIILKAWEDESFRQRLLSDPAQALSAELGVEFPKGVQIRVHEETPAKVMLRLMTPPGEMEASEELSDEDLEAVAGGAGRANPYFVYTDEGDFFWAARKMPPIMVPGTPPSPAPSPEPDEEPGECPTDEDSEGGVRFK